jgi:hypothetical protein
MKSTAEKTKNISNDDIRKILRVLSEYEEGKFIYPGYLASDLEIDLDKVYLILDNVLDHGYLEKIYEIKGKERKRYDYLSSIPCNEFISAYVIYKLKTKMNFRKELDNDKSVCINEKVFYYDPKKIELTEKLMQELSAFKGTEKSYFVYYDSSQGLVIY